MSDFRKSLMITAIPIAAFYLIGGVVVAATRNEAAGAILGLFWASSVILLLQALLIVVILVVVGKSQAVAVVRKYAGTNAPLDGEAAAEIARGKRKVRVAAGILAGLGIGLLAAFATCFAVTITRP